MNKISRYFSIQVQYVARMKMPQIGAMQKVLSYCENKISL